MNLNIQNEYFFKKKCSIKIVNNLVYDGKCLELVIIDLYCK